MSRSSAAAKPRQPWRLPRPQNRRPAGLGGGDSYTHSGGGLNPASGLRRVMAGLWGLGCLGCLRQYVPAARHALGCRTIDGACLILDTGKLDVQSEVNGEIDAPSINCFEGAQRSSISFSSSRKGFVS
jgi:hypothetical protein